MLATPTTCNSNLFKTTPSKCRHKPEEKEDCSQQLATSAARERTRQNQRRKKSADLKWLPLPPWRESGKKYRRKKSALSNWLQMLQRREAGEKQRRKKHVLGH